MTTESRDKIVNKDKMVTAVLQDAIDTITQVYFTEFDFEKYIERCYEESYTLSVSGRHYKIRENTDYVYVGAVPTKRFFFYDIETFRRDFERCGCKVALCTCEYKLLGGSLMYKRVKEKNELKEDIKTDENKEITDEPRPRNRRSTSSQTKNCTYIERVNPITNYDTFFNYLGYFVFLIFFLVFFFFLVQN